LLTFLPDGNIVLPFFRKKAESRQPLLIAHSPNPASKLSIGYCIDHIVPLSQLREPFVFPTPVMEAWFQSRLLKHLRAAHMNINVLTPVRLLGDGLVACFSSRPDMRTVAVFNDLANLRDKLSTTESHVVLIDLTQGFDLFDVRAIASDWPNIPLVALGLTEQRQEVIRCGRAGFAGYLLRDASY